jgi:hypothetical protein
MVLGDAIGAPVEFCPLRYGKSTVTGFNVKNGGNFHLKAGQ